VARELDIPLVVESLSQSSYAEQYEHIWDTLDEPTADISILPTTTIYKRINGRAKVVLSGEGGDESFGGYTRSTILMRHNSVSERDLANSLLNALLSPDQFNLSHINPLVQRIRTGLIAHGLTDDLVGAYLKTTRIIDYPLYDRELRKRLAAWFEREYDERIPRALAFDMLAYLPDDLLTKSDNASMASSIEARVPFVDRLLVSTVAAVLPTIDAAHALNDKRILKDALSRYVSRDLIFRPKRGFGIPMAMYDTKAFTADFDAACEFHLKDRTVFGLNDELVTMIRSRGSREIIARKYPRFAFALISNWKCIGV
jgi:asparagine synthase (glutamine-hydrolysing)